MNAEYFCQQNQAKLDFDCGKYDKSRSIWEKCLELNPDDFINYTYISIIYFLQGNQESAQEIWFHFLFNYTEDELKNISNLIYEVAYNQQEKNKFFLAMQLYEQTLEFNENHALSYLNLGYLLAITGKLETAFDYWQKATEIDPNLSIAYYHQARQYQRLKDYQLAIDNYQKALSLEPNNLNYWHSLGICLVNDNQLNLAINYQKKCLKINNHFYYAYGELGYIALLNLDLQTAFNSWKLLVYSQQELFNKYTIWLEKSNNKSLHIVSSLIRNLISKNDYAKLYSIIANLFYQKAQYHTAIYYYYLTINQEIQSSDNYYHLILSLFYTKQSHQVTELLEKLKLIDQNKHQQIILLLDQNKKTEKNGQIKVPINYQEKLIDYLKEQNLLKDNYYAIYQENIIHLQPPKTIEKYINPSFQFSSEIQLPASFVGILSEGRYWLREDEASSAVISSDNQLIGDLSPESPALSPGHPDSHPSNHSIFKNKFLPPIEYIKGTVVVLLGLLNKVYFHWLFDIVPRFKLLELSGINLEEVDYFLVDNSNHFQQETLSILGIPSAKIKPLLFPLHLQAKKLIIPSFPGTIAWIPRWSCDYLKEIILGDLHPSKTLNKRIYISRKNAKTRRLINEEEIINLLQKYQFEVVNLEKLSIREQAQLLASAEIIVGVHGSGLSNLVFCRPQTKVIEIFAPFYVYPCYWLISNLLNLDYYYVEGEIIGSEHFYQLIYPDSRVEDIYLNSNKLNSMLNSL